MNSINYRFKAVPDLKITDLNNWWSQPITEQPILQDFSCLNTLRLLYNLIHLTFLL